jgi:transcription elongation factor Elf1
MEKKIDTAFECTECGNSDNDKLMIIRDAPWVVECTVCGHPNDARWDHDMIDVYRHEVVTVLRNVSDLE